MFGNIGQIILTSRIFVNSEATSLYSNWFDIVVAILNQCLCLRWMSEREMEAIAQCSWDHSHYVTVVLAKQCNVRAGIDLVKD